jgi:hypothetical protein
MGGLGQLVDLQAHQIGQEKEKPAAPSGEGAAAQRESPHIGHRFDGGPRVLGPFVIQTAGQSGEPLGFEHFPDGGGAEGTPLFFESVADLVDRMVLFAQLHDELAGGGLFGLSLGAPSGGDKKDGVRIPAEVVTEDVKSAWGIAEVTRDIFGGLGLEKESAEGFVLALPGVVRLQKEAAKFA